MASTNFQELFFLKTIFKPFYLPIIWILHLINNLLIKKVYFESQNNILSETNNNGFVHKLNELFNIIRRKKKKIQPKEEISVNSLSLPKHGDKKTSKTTNKQQHLPLSSQSGFILPNIDLLINQKVENLTPDKDILNANAKLLEGVLIDYSI